MKNSQIFSAGLAVLVLAIACSQTAPPTDVPASPAPTAVKLAETQTLTVSPVPSPTSKATDALFATITSFPSITPIPPTSIYTAIPTTYVLTLTQIAGPPGPLRCHLLSSDPAPGTIMKPLNQFAGIWHIFNSGTQAWTTDDIAFFFLGGTAFHPSTYREKFIPYPVNPGDQLNLRVPMKAPREPGLYSAIWGLRSKVEMRIFCSVTMFIVVQEK